VKSSFLTFISHLATTYLQRVSPGLSKSLWRNGPPYLPDLSQIFWSGYIWHAALYADAAARAAVFEAETAVSRPCKVVRLPEGDSPGKTSTNWEKFWQLVAGRH